MNQATSSRDRWKRIDALFHEALAQDAASREAFLRRSCGTDQALFHELSRLVTLSEKEDEFLDPPNRTQVLGLPDAAGQEHLVGRRIGAFRLVKPIAHGGMGAVWLAARADEQFEQRVAVKLMHSGLLTPEMRRRFRQERQTLAQLEHPYITRLIDGGTTAEDLPYLVMEFVDGLPIGRYCDENRLAIPERLRLFRMVCEAVHCAHQNLIVHRDLKPSNILVCEDGRPKLLDFGISKLIDAGLDGMTGDPTVTLLRGLTPRYASPEQIRGERITTATDVYSLGVVLYELLTGHRPYQLENRSRFERERIVCEQEPTAPSIVVRRSTDLVAREGDTEPASPKTVAAARRESPEQLFRHLRGDLDNIVLMALEKDPKRRYTSVEQFSEDIARYLGDRPVLARKDTLAYRSAKFVRRNARVVTMLATVALIATIGVSVAVRQSRIAQNERLAKDWAESKAESMQWFLQGTLFAPGPARQGEGLTRFALLAQTAKRIKTELADRPEVEALVRLDLGRTYAAMRMNVEAVRHLRPSLEFYREVYGDNRLEMAACLSYLGELLTAQRDPESVSMLTEALEIRRNHLGEQDKLVADVKCQLALALATVVRPQRFAEAETLLDEALATYHGLFDEGHRSFARWTYSAARLQVLRGDRAKAEGLYRRAKDQFERINETTDPEYVNLLGDLGSVLQDMGDLEAARMVLTDFAKLVPESSGEWRVADAEMRLAGLEHRAGRFEDALAHYRASLASHCSVLARRHSEFAGDLTALAARLLGITPGTRDEDPGQPYLYALSKLREHGILRELQAANLCYWVADASLHVGAVEDAEVLARAGMVIRHDRIPGDHCPDTHGLMGAALTRLERFGEAQRHLVQSYRLRRDRRGRWRGEVAVPLERLEELYKAWGKPKKAEVYHRMRGTPRTRPVV